MRRRANVVWALVVVMAGAFSIVVNTEVQEREGRLDRINSAVADHHEAINVLRAEWSYLNQPGRLEALARRHLNLQPPLPGQVMRISELPFAGRPDAPVDVANAVSARRPSLPLSLQQLDRPAPVVAWRDRR